MILLQIFLFTSPSYATWGKNVDPHEIFRYKRVSVMFATQNLKYPASHFGHIIMIFHNSDIPEPDSITVEYSTQLNTSIDYMSTLFDKANGRYLFNYFSNKSREYELEDRSMWIYEISLSKANIDQLKRILISFEGKKYNYGILKKNCAHYMIQPLLSVTQLPYKTESYLFISPDSVLRWLREKGILKSSLYIPSKQLMALNAFKLLPVDQKKNVRLLMAGYSLRGNSVSEKSKHAILQIAGYKIIREPDFDKRNHLLGLIKKYSTKSLSLSPSFLRPPDPSQLKGNGLFSLFTNIKSKEGIFSFRPGFLGPENDVNYELGNISNEFARVDVYISESKNYIHRFTLFSSEGYYPLGYLREASTQIVDISYINYAPYFGESHEEVSATFGRGLTVVFHEHQFSFVPFLSLKSISGIKSGEEAVLAGRFHQYGPIGETFRYSFTVDDFFMSVKGISRHILFEIFPQKFSNFGISFRYSQVDSGLSRNMYGLRLYASY